MPKPDILLRSKKKKAQALFHEQRIAEARDLYRQICQLDRLDPENWFSLALLNAKLGELEEAAACNHRATTLRPDYAEAHFNHATALHSLGRPHQAEQGYRRALALRPQWSAACNALGNVLEDLGRPREAMALYRQAVAMNPADLNARINLANALRQCSEYHEAIDQCRAILAAHPTNTGARKVLGSAHFALGQFDDALASYRQAAELDPADLDSVAAQAEILERQGKGEQAFNLIHPYVEDGRANLAMANVLAVLCDKLGGCDEAIALLERRLSDRGGAVSADLRRAAHFSLGRLYDRAKQYDPAFAHFKAANDLKPADFDRATFTRFIDDLIETFDAGFMQSAPRARHGSSRPVFIVGMMRSGTSLVEQILASHPEVHGGGELEDIRQIAAGVSALLGSPRPYPHVVRELTADSCDALAARYLNKLAALSADARYVTDKMPQNFLSLGLIALLFPGARVIHCRRDPIDTCLSCYFRDFTGYHPYVYRLEHLGFYYRGYQRLMRHWQAVLPIPMLEVAYEDLVADPEAGTRQLLAFCDLPWDDRCLRFYETERIIHTSSYQQVRKPIYKSSLARWRHYAAHLAPLRQALEGSEDPRA